MQWLMDKLYFGMNNHWEHDCAIRQDIVVTSAWHKHHLISSSQPGAIKHWDILLFFTSGCYPNRMSTRSEKSCFSTLFEVAKEVIRQNFRFRIFQVFWNKLLIWYSWVLRLFYLKSLKKKSYSVSFVELGLTVTVWEDHLLSPCKWLIGPHSFLVNFRCCGELLLARGLKSACIMYTSDQFDNILFCV